MSVYLAQLTEITLEGKIMLISEGRLDRLEDRSKELTTARLEIERLVERVTELESFIEAEGRCLLVPKGDD